MMTGNGVMHNGTTTVDDYGQNLDKLKVATAKKTEINKVQIIILAKGWRPCRCGEEGVWSTALLCQ